MKESENLGSRRKFESDGPMASECNPGNDYVAAKQGQPHLELFKTLVLQLTPLYELLRHISRAPVSDLYCPTIPRCLWAAYPPCLYLQVGPVIDRLRIHLIKLNEMLRCDLDILEGNELFSNRRK